MLIAEMAHRTLVESATTALVARLSIARGLQSGVGEGQLAQPPTEAGELDASGAVHSE
jgi:hypothetical protein